MHIFLDFLWCLQKKVLPLYRNTKNTQLSTHTRRVLPITVKMSVGQRESLIIKYKWTDMNMTWTLYP